jgi:hypothetical protein
MESPLWTPSADRVERARITHFMRLLRERGMAEVSDYRSL